MMACMGATAIERVNNTKGEEKERERENKCWTMCILRRSLVRCCELLLDESFSLLPHETRTSSPCHQKSPSYMYINFYIHD